MVRVNWANPLTRQLSFLYDPVLVRDAVSGAVGTKSGSLARDTFADASGMAGAMVGYRSPTGSQSAAKIEFPFNRPIGNDEFSMLCWVRHTDTPLGGIVAFTLSGGTNSAWIDSDNNGKAGNAGPLAAGGTASDLEPICLIRRSGTLYIYRNGTLANSTAAGSYALGTPTLVTILRTSGVNLRGTAVPFAAAWNRALTDQEVAAVSRNPWQLFISEAANDPLLAEVAAAVGGAGVTIQAAVGAAYASDVSATVASSISIAAYVGAAAGSGIAATVSSPISVTATAGAATATGVQATVSSSIVIGANAGAATASGVQASVSSSAAVSATPGVATAAGVSANVASPISITATAGAAAATGVQAGISTGSSITALAGAAAASGVQATISAPDYVVAQAGAAAASGVQATIGSGITIPAGIGAATALGLTATVTATTHIVAGVGAATARGVAATIDNLSLESKVDLLLAKVEALETSCASLLTTVGLMAKILRNKTVTDPLTGVMTVYDDDSTTPYLTAQMYEGTSTAQTYRGQGAERRERLT